MESFFLFVAGLVPRLLLLLMHVQPAIVVADVDVNTEQEKPHDDILDQIDFVLRAGVSPVTVVTEIDGIRSLSASAGRGVIYLGESALPAILEAELDIDVAVEELAVRVRHGEDCDASR